MQRRTQANWQQHLMSAILRGTFFMSTEIALGMRQQVADLINKSDIYTNNIQRLDAIDIKAYDGDRESEADETIQEESRVIVLPIKGTMLKYGTLCSYGMDEIAYYTKYFAAREDTSAIVLDIDTGGGATNSVPPMLEAIEFVKSNNKPVVAHVDYACSAGQWVAAACDQIFLDNKQVSTVGSIGVMISMLDMIPYYEEKGAKYHEVYADQSGDKNLAFQKFLKGEYDQIKEEMLNPLAVQFQTAIKESRGSKLKLDTPGLLTGATFTGQKAIDVGLADQFGTLQHAINYAAAQAWANS